MFKSPFHLLPPPPPPPEAPKIAKKKRNPPDDEQHKAKLKALKEMSRLYITNDENLVAKDMYRLHRNNWPQMLIVTAGCEGETDFVTFACEEVLRIDREFNYKCVLARDKVGKIVSIPLDFEIKCKVVRAKKESEEMTISEIIDKHDLPITVKFAVPDSYIFNVGETSHRADSFGVMALLKLYDETYLVANPVIDGVLDPHIIIVPLYLEMLLATIVGSETMSVEEWNEYFDELKKEAETIDYSSVKGRKAMALYPEIPEEAEDMDEYSYIRPDSYVILRDASGDFSKNRLTYSHVYRCDDDDNFYDEIMPLLPPRSPAKPKKPAEPEKPAVPKRVKSKESFSEPKPKPLVPERNATRAYVASLTVAELGEKLKLLKMGKYVKKFAKEGIDGEILVDIEEAVLKKDFGFKDFEAIKLRKFVQTGHIPQ